MRSPVAGRGHGRRPGHAPQARRWLVAAAGRAFRAHLARFGRDRGEHADPPRRGHPGRGALADTRTRRPGPRRDPRPGAFPGPAQGPSPSTTSPAPSAATHGPSPSPGPTPGTSPDPARGPGPDTSPTGGRASSSSSQSRSPRADARASPAGPPQERQPPGRTPQGPGRRAEDGHRTGMVPACRPHDPPRDNVRALDGPFLRPPRSRPGADGKRISLPPLDGPANPATSGRRAASCGSADPERGKSSRRPGASTCPARGDRPSLAARSRPSRSNPGPAAPSKRDGPQAAAGPRRAAEAGRFREHAAGRHTGTISSQSRADTGSHHRTRARDRAAEAASPPRSQAGGAPPRANRDHPDLSAERKRADKKADPGPPSARHGQDPNLPRIGSSDPDEPAGRTNSPGRGSRSASPPRSNRAGIGPGRPAGRGGRSQGLRGWSLPRSRNPGGRFRYSGCRGSSSLRNAGNRGVDRSGTDHSDRARPPDRRSGAPRLFARTCARRSHGPGDRAARGSSRPR